MRQGPEFGEDPSGGERVRRAGALLAGLSECSNEVRAVADGLADLAGREVTAPLGSGPVLHHDVIALGRIRHLLDAVLGDRVVVAEAADVLPHAPATVLARNASWGGGPAYGLVAAARLARRFPELRRLWIDGLVSTEHLSVIATPTHCLTDSQMTTLLDILTPRLPRLSVRATRIAVRHALDLLRPQDAKHAEQHDWDRRGISYSSHGGMVLIAADLPQVEGETLITVLNSLGESLRVGGDGLTDAQRRADAMITLVDRAASHGDLPATTNGLPVATTITVGLPEAERVAEGRERPTPATGTDVVAAAAHRGTLATSSRSPATLGDAALRFALCAGELTGVLIDDGRQTGGIGSALGATQLLPLALGRSVRLASTAQRRSLALRDGGCLLCHAPATQCQTHHVRPWSDGGRTDVDSLVLLCWTHHRAVDLNRWTISRNSGYRTGDTEPYWKVTPVPRDRWRSRE